MYTPTTHLLLLASVTLASLAIPSDASTTMDVTPVKNGSDTHQLLNTMAHAFNDIAKKASPAVVSISTVKSVSAREAALAFGELPGMGPEGTLPGLGGGPQEMVGMGSGVIIRPDGLIITNNHVIEKAERITVVLDEKHRVPAHLIGADPKTDLAVIMLDTPQKNLPVLTFSSSQDIQVGDWAIAIGSPFGLTQSMTFGIVSALGRARMGILDTEDFIQTDAAINPGSSGGPLLNSNGEIIGINTAIFSQGGGFVGIGFAIPADTARDITTQLADHGKVLRGWIGLVAQDMDESLAHHFKVPNDHGALVSDVAPIGPAFEAKIQPGDVIVGYNNHEVDSAQQLKSLVGKTPAGSQVPLQILRGGRAIPVALNVSESPLQKAREEAHPHQLAGQIAKPRDANFGLTVEELPRELTRFLKLAPKSAVIVTKVIAGSPSFDAGLNAGDIILKLNESPLHGVKDFREQTRRLKEDETEVLYIQRGPDERTFVPLKG